jgi:hypothetical protein
MSNRGAFASSSCGWRAVRLLVPEGRFLRSIASYPAGQAFSSALSSAGLALFGDESDVPIMLVFF